MDVLDYSFCGAVEQLDARGEDSLGQVRGRHR